jgi:hypothetical protein
MGFRFRFISNHLPLVGSGTRAARPRAATRAPRLRQLHAPLRLDAMNRGEICAKILTPSHAMH